MKSLFCAFLVAVVAMAGCGKGKKQGIPVKFETVSVTSVASGAKTKAGKPVDAYEVKGTTVDAVFLIVGGGQLSSSGASLKLNDNEFLVENSLMKNSVLVVDKNRPAPLPLPNVLPADAKAKCAAGKAIELPIDELLAMPRPGM